jgi:hypothetical protein
VVVGETLTVMTGGIGGVELFVVFVDPPPQADSMPTARSVKANSTARGLDIFTPFERVSVPLQARWRFSGFVSMAGRCFVDAFPMKRHACQVTWDGWVAVTGRKLLVLKQVLN